MRTTAYLCVHGIGVHDSGALVDEVVGSVRRGAESLGGELREAPADPAARSELAHRAVVEVPGQQPFHAEFYDGWWARRVQPPRFWAVMLWVLRVTPFVLLNTGSLWLADRMSEQSDRRDRVTLSALLPAGLFLALTPLAVVLLPVVLVVSAVVPRWRDQVKRIVVDVIGDAWLYRSQELDTTVLPHLRTLAQDLRRRADCVVLVGHSQGAELTRRVGLLLESGDSLNRGGELEAVEGSAEDSYRFVWIGSGENQLNTVRTLARSRFLPLVFWPYLALWPVFVYGAATRLMAFPSDISEFGRTREWGPIVISMAWDLGFLLAFVCYIGAGVLLTRWTARPPRDAGKLPAGLGWYVQSVLDPVSYGSAAVRASAQDPRAVKIRYVPTSGGRRWWREHVTYFDKPETGHVLIESGLARPQRLAPRVVPQIPWWLLLVSGAASALVLVGGYYVGRWQWGLFW